MSKEQIGKLSEEEVALIEQAREKKEQENKEATERKREQITKDAEQALKKEEELFRERELLLEGYLVLSKAYPSKWNLVENGDRITHTNDDNLYIYLEEHFVRADNWGIRRSSKGLKFKYKIPGSYDLDGRYYKNIKTIGKNVETHLEQQVCEVASEQRKRDLEKNTVTYLKKQFTDAVVVQETKCVRLSRHNAAGYSSHEEYRLDFSNGAVVRVRSYDNTKDIRGFTVTIVGIDVSSVGKTQIETIAAIGNL